MESNKRVKQFHDDKHGFLLYSNTCINTVNTPAPEGMVLRKKITSLEGRIGVELAAGWQYILIYLNQ